MGVNILLLDRRMVTVRIGTSRQTVGTLRRFFKFTELDEERAAEVEAAGRITPSPVAAMVMDVSDLTLASDPAKPVAAHLVLGWEEGRGRTTDFGWDFLPELGYAVRDPKTQDYTLYERRDDQLHPIDAARAADLGLLDPAGCLVRRGQPVITACENVRPVLDQYADADCTLSTGRRETLMTRIKGGELPPADWFIGKTPSQITHYPPERPSSGTAPTAAPHP